MKNKWIIRIHSKNSFIKILLKFWPIFPPKSHFPPELQRFRVLSPANKSSRKRALISLLLSSLPSLSLYALLSSIQFICNKSSIIGSCKSVSMNTRQKGTKKKKKCEQESRWARFHFFVSSCNFFFRESWNVLSIPRQLYDNLNCLRVFSFVERETPSGVSYLILWGELVQNGLWFDFLLKWWTHDREIWVILRKFEDTEGNLLSKCSFIDQWFLFNKK